METVEKATTEDWKALFARYSHIVLVANSDAVDMALLRREMPDTALFVFFNKVYKILDEPFDRHALLVARSGTMGANIVHRREAGDVLRFFPGRDFLGVLNIRVDATERMSAAADFGNVAVRHLDLVDYFKDFYPEGKFATSGFALALWLCELRLDASVVLAGFSARRSEKWKVFSVHDWTFEQVFLRLFARLGRINILGGADRNPYSVLASRFPEIPAAEIALATAEVLAERLENANNQIDRLISVTKTLRSVDSFLRRLKPKTRKEKFLAKSQAEKDG